MDTMLATIGIVVKEPWAVDISYEMLNYTLYRVEDGGDGCGYIALKDNIGVTPGSDETVWRKAVQAGQSIYDLAVKYHHFVGTEEEFEAQYQAALQAALDAAASATAAEAQVEAAEALRVQAESSRESAETARAAAESARATAEDSRETAESSRASAESSRVSAETGRSEAETARQGAEQTRQSNEEEREEAEGTRTQQFEALKADMQVAIGQADAAATAATEAAASAVETEENIEAAEASRVTAEQGRVTAEQGRASAEQGRVSAESARVTAEAARETQAGADHTRAGSDHTQAGNDHTRAESDHTRAGNDHIASAEATLAANNAAGTANDAAAAADAARRAIQGDLAAKADKDTDAVEGNVAQFDANGNPVDSGEKIGDYAKKEDLESGNIIPALAGNLESWAEDVSEVSNTWDETIRSTAGDDPIDTSFGGIITDIVAKSDFKCDSIKTSGYNLLRLASNGGVATAIGTGLYFPVPRLELGAFGDATKNNGVLFTARNGQNIKNATVRFKALSDGLPTSVDDGVAATYQDVTYNDETYRTYLTSGEGYLIVSGITYADTCAHLAWEDWYDKFVDPADAGDSGDSINLAPLFSAAPNGTGKFLALGSGGNIVATRATRTGATQMTITDPIARVASPSWINELQEDEETYKHSLTIGSMKPGGLAQIEGSSQVLIVEGTTVSYIDTNATAIPGAVRYEKATPATAVVTLAKTQYAVNDCGIEIKSVAIGEAYFGGTYSQNVADALSQIAKVKLDISLSVVAEAMLYLYNEYKSLLKLLTGNDNAVLPYIKAQAIECENIMTMGAPSVLMSDVAGAPSADNTPYNWDENTMDVWDGCPRKVGQVYVDQASKKVYFAAVVTGSTNDWVALN